MASGVVRMPDTHVAGTLTAETMNLPANAVTDTSVIAAANIAASKLEHQRAISVELFGPTTTVAALTKLLHVVRGATGSVYAAEAVIITAATGGDRTVTVDIQKSTGGGAFATVLTTTINITNGTAVRTAVAAVVNSTPAALVDGDILQAVVTVAGVAGNQALGLLLTVTVKEKAD